MNLDLCTKDNIPWMQFNCRNCSAVCAFDFFFVVSGIAVAPTNGTNWSWQLMAVSPLRKAILNISLSSSSSSSSSLIVGRNVSFFGSWKRERERERERKREREREEKSNGAGSAQLPHRLKLTCPSSLTFSRLWNPPIPPPPPSPPSILIIIYLIIKLTS